MTVRRATWCVPGPGDRPGCLGNQFGGRRPLEVRWQRRLLLRRVRLGPRPMQSNSRPLERRRQRRLLLGFARQRAGSVRAARHGSGCDNSAGRLGRRRRTSSRGRRRTAPVTVIGIRGQFCACRPDPGSKAAPRRRNVTPSPCCAGLANVTSWTPATMGCRCGAGRRSRARGRATALPSDAPRRGSRPPCTAE